MLVALGLPAVAQAQEFTVADIIVDGYQRISPGIIYNLLPIGIGDVVTERTALRSSVRWSPRNISMKSKWHEKAIFL